MTQGKIRWYNPEKGYGFIMPGDGSKDVFVHAREVQRSSVVSSLLVPDQVVSYTVNQGPKGPFATELKIVK